MYIYKYKYKYNNMSKTLLLLLIINFIQINALENKKDLFDVTQFKYLK